MFKKPVPIFKHLISEKGIAERKVEFILKSLPAPADTFFIPSLYIES